MPAVQTQSPVLQGKMLVPMATVRAAPAPSQQFPLVAPPLPVQNGAQAGSKVKCQTFKKHKINATITCKSYHCFPSRSFRSLPCLSSNRNYPLPDQCNLGARFLLLWQQLQWSPQALPRLRRCCYRPHLQGIANTRQAHLYSPSTAQ